MSPLCHGSGVLKTDDVMGSYQLVAAMTALGELVIEEALGLELQTRAVLCPHCAKDGETNTRTSFACEQIQLVLIQAAVVHCFNPSRLSVIGRTEVIKNRN